MPARDLVHHEPEEGKTVRHGERVGVGEVCLELPGCILVVEGEHVPAEAVHGGHDLVDHGIVVEQGSHVVGRLVQSVTLAHRGETPFPFILEHTELRFHAQVEPQAHGGRPGQRTFEDAAAARFEGAAVQHEIAGEPGNLRVPGQHGRGRRIRKRRHLVVVHRLRNAVQGGSREHLGRPEHAGEVVDGNRLGLGDAMQVHIGGQAVLHALGREGGARHRRAMTGWSLHRTRSRTQLSIS